MRNTMFSFAGATNRSETMKALRIVSRIVTGLYILSAVCLVLAAAAWREMLGIATYAFIMVGLVNALMVAIEWLSRRYGRDEP
jgi:hypothetical protein